MSIYKRDSGRYAVLVDVDPEPFRLLAEIPNDGRRLTKTIGTFTSRGDAEKRRARLVKDGDPRTLIIEENARGRRSLGTFPTKKDAEEAEREALTARDRGSIIAPGTATVAEILERYHIGREDLGRELKTQPSIGAKLGCTSFRILETGPLRSCAQLTSASGYPLCYAAVVRVSGLSRLKVCIMRTHC